VINFIKMKTLLAASSEGNFSELNCQKLEETGRFHLRIAGDMPMAVPYVKYNTCLYAFLDSGLAEQDLLEIGNLMLKQTVRYASSFSRKLVGIQRSMN
jgi:hypothetical protein